MIGCLVVIITHASSLITFRQNRRHTLSLLLLLLLWIFSYKFLFFDFNQMTKVWRGHKTAMARRWRLSNTRKLVAVFPSEFFIGPALLLLWIAVGIQTCLCSSISAPSWLYFRTALLNLNFFIDLKWPQVCSELCSSLLKGWKLDGITTGPHSRLYSFSRLSQQTLVQLSWTHSHIGSTS